MAFTSYSSTKPINKPLNSYFTFQSICIWCNYRNKCWSQPHFPSLRPGSNHSDPRAAKETKKKYQTKYYTIATRLPEKFKSEMRKLEMGLPSPEPPRDTATAVFFFSLLQWKEPPPKHYINTPYRKLGQISGNWQKKKKKSCPWRTPPMMSCFPRPPPLRVSPGLGTGWFKADRKINHWGVRVRRRTRRGCPGTAGGR